MQPTESGRQTPEQWSRFWESGSLTSFFGRFGDNYEGELLAFWYLEFRKLPSGAKVIDLGTGNGALALLAAQYSESNDKHFDVTGLDYADISPDQHIKDDERRTLARSITFLGNTNIEDTGLATGSFDAAISQFGFEYGDPERTAVETSRLLRSAGAKFIAMMHHDNSAITKQAEDGLLQVAECENSGLQLLITELLKRLESIKQQGLEPARDEQAESLRHRLNEVTGNLHEACDKFRDPSMLPFFLKNSMAVFNSQLAGNKTLQEKFDMLQEVQQETDDYKQRMQDLVSAANSKEAIDVVERRFREEKFSIERSEPFLFEGVDFCHCLIATR